MFRRRSADPSESPAADIAGHGSTARQVAFQSHLGQDNWVAEVYGFKPDGYFFEAGALDGVLTSNTYALEKHLGWSGIVVEANPTYYPEVCRNRSCITINAALWRSSREQIEMVDAHGLSSAVQNQDGDSSSSLRRSITTRTIHIDTVNPSELFDRFAVPATFEYLSLDIEGAELDFLKAFDFTRYRPGLMTIEHTEDLQRQDAMRSLLAPFGYEFRQRHYDEYFWHPDVVGALGGSDPNRAFDRVDEAYEIYDH
jgi:FkbM family methyltransferase